MRDRKINNNKIKLNKYIYVFIFLLFLVLGGRLVYLCTYNYNVGNITISQFIENRNIKEDTILPERGTIYDSNGNALAEDVSSYTVIAYLDEKRSEGSDTLRHVKNIEETAAVLEPYLNTSKEKLIELLSKDAYQVELGSGGRNLSQLEMEKIASLNLPGIDFIKSTKRYYPNGDFASYLLGYTKNKDVDGNEVKVGELGIEEYFNDNLTGTNGYITYERDRYGYKIANGREYVKNAVNGDDIYLTIDNNIQLFIENAVKDTSAKSEASWVVMGVMDAKTGAILGYSSTPSFDPNIRNMSSYLDPFVNYVYEPGSTMKIFSFMCAIDSGKYNGSDTYMSGSKTYTSVLDPNDTTTIFDWKKTGWGEITYDRGFALSSNIAVANLLDGVMTKKELASCYDRYGFGKKTGISLSRELTGDVSFKYDIEAAAAGYGQGITITPVQMLQALSGIANNGTMLQPYIVSKIVDSNTGVVKKEYGKTAIGKMASESTINKIKDLMESVIDGDPSVATGYAYYIDGFDIIGKTGTAQIFDNKSGKYYSGANDYTYSFAGMYPKDDPEIIIYMALQKPKDSVNYVAPAVKEVLTNINKYLNINTGEEVKENVYLSSYINKNVNDVVSELNSKGINTVVIGNGDKVVNQYPGSSTVLLNDKVYLLTNNYNKEMIDVNGMSYKDATNILKMLGINYETEGIGYAYEQSVLPGSVVEDKVIIKFKNNY